MALYDPGQQRIIRWGPGAQDRPLPCWMLGLLSPVAFPTHPAQPRRTQRVSQGEGALACQPCSRIPWHSPRLLLPQALVK